MGMCGAEPCSIELGRARGILGNGACASGGDGRVQAPREQLAARRAHPNQTDIRPGQARADWTVSLVVWRNVKRLLRGRQFAQVKRIAFAPVAAPSGANQPAVGLCRRHNRKSFSVKIVVLHGVDCSCCNGQDGPRSALVGVDVVSSVRVRPPVDGPRMQRPDVGAVRKAKDADLGRQASAPRPQRRLE